MIVEIKTETFTDVTIHGNTTRLMPGSKAKLNVNTEEDIIQIEIKYLDLFKDERDEYWKKKETLNLKET